MTNRSVGLTLMFGGVVITMVGLTGWAMSGSSEPDPASSTTTTTSVTTTSEPTTTSSTTTTIATTTTSTTIPTTTTTIDATSAIESFVDTFTDAIGRQDTELLLEALHPAVINLFGEETCRVFISEEILQLERYRLIGEVRGPTPQVIADTTVKMYMAPTAFVIQGQEFTSDADFAFEDGEVRWFAQCRG